MSTHQAAVIGCFIALFLAIIGAMVTEKKIIKEAKEVPMDRSIINITFLGISLIEILPMFILIFTIIVILN